MTPEEIIDARILSVLEQAGRDAVEDIQGTVNTAWPPPSEPDTEPHRRSGALHDGIVYEIEQAGPVTVLTVISTVFYSGYLEDGTGRMKKRPFMAPARDRWAPVVHQRLTEAFSTSAPVLTV
jgi:HK97 gp10 family phage protein